MGKYPLKEEGVNGSDRQQRKRIGGCGLDSFSVG
jgi:hypothetical protein